MSAAANNSGGQSSAYAVGGRNASSPARRISTGRRHSVGAGSPDFRLVSAAAGNQRRNAAIDRKFVVSDLLTIVTLAGAYYCINKLKSILPAMANLADIVFAVGLTTPPLKSTAVGDVTAEAVVDDNDA